ncbi:MULTISPECIES: RsmB/NOP family class I SAM-dependent RNA methyltransferase [Sphingobium]|jgi:16S rRNA (cytosine967-C5)-methyltransferase|uniref:RsmB/NOP family class I SAM-dependent RNA methyltransferase n=1 Tax=Sphingobium TaxID=165695 RepID=UPI000DBB3BBE|nr:MULTISPECIES: RsmB/NOP family class I SAM-dependent RNA methyltransferase [Sphingobium]KAA9019101.1 RsmB/NOP family class I SAM-dependent RNA methyltransferase [Sphingobium limneticum]MBU0932841.1 RsmB/NOP family class I SAM-dependent RNA methyltransferase [Alphaproteobacteria bacterium]BBC98831.1 16S rRNA (cytosine967-C5)-methyltransferase [Sphingobium sp. YG1]
MTPSARIQAAIDLLDAIIASARDGGPAADTLIARYFKERRYAGSRDRRAVRDHVYDAIRRAAERPETGREAMIGVAQARPDVAALFDGSAHAPLPIEPGELGAQAGAVPAWLQPLLAAPVEQDALLGRAPVDVRVNRLKADPAAVAPMLPDAVAIAGLSDGLRLPEGYSIEQQAAWADGLVEVQDAGSQWISAACGVQPDMTVVDMCAGAGGKTLALAAAMAGQGTLIAADTIRSRLARLEPRAARAGATFIETLLLDQSHEARGLESLRGKADVVLVDAPCSGTGTWRRNPEARWRLTQARLDRLVGEQARILDFAAPLLAPGGLLVYATCALTDREGRGQVDAFLRRHDGWSAEPIDLPVGRSHGEGLLLTPGHDGSDGFFFARLRRGA